MEQGTWNIIQLKKNPRQKDFEARKIIRELNDIQNNRFKQNALKTC